MQLGASTLLFYLSQYAIPFCTLLAQEHYGKSIPDKVCLLGLGWYTKEVVVLYLVCERCRKQGCHVEKNRGQRMISKRQLEEIKWYGCSKVVERKAVRPIEEKV